MFSFFEKFKPFGILTAESATESLAQFTKDREAKLMKEHFYFDVDKVEVPVKIDYEGKYREAKEHLEYFKEMRD